MPSLVSTLRLAARSLRRTPAFTAAAVLTLALGIGATAAIFSVVNGVLLRPLPYAQPERLVGLWFSFPGLGVPQAPMSDGTYFLTRRENRVFEDLGASSEGAVNLTTGEGAERVTTAWVTASLLPTLRVPPLHGRLITADPAALSVAPVPACHESKCAPIITTSSALSVPGISPTMLNIEVSS